MNANPDTSATSEVGEQTDATRKPLPAVRIGILGGLLVMAVLIMLALPKRNQCSVAGVRSFRKKILISLGVAVATYAALYALTTWLGSLGTQ